MSESTPPVQRPATRAARLSAIEQVLLKHIVTSQSQLSDLLSQEGIEVTQATLSRDLDEINAMKTRLSNGSIAYTIGDRPLRESVGSGIGSKAEQQMSRVLSGLVTRSRRPRTWSSSTRLRARPSMWRASSTSSPSTACSAPSQAMTR